MIPALEKMHIIKHQLDLSQYQLLSLYAVKGPVMISNN